LKFRFLILAVSVGMSFSIFASTKTEIDHLLNYVKSTACLYERNGTMHSGKEAFKHIEKKYKYYLDDIENTEDFIKYSATKSTMSGKHYKVHCGNKPVIASKDWLLLQLKKFREEK